MENNCKIENNETIKLTSLSFPSGKKYKLPHILEFDKSVSTETMTSAVVLYFCELFLEEIN